MYGTTIKTRGGSYEAFPHHPIFHPDMFEYRWAKKFVCHPLKLAEVLASNNPEGVYSKSFLGILKDQRVYSLFLKTFLCFSYHVLLSFIL